MSGTLIVSAMRIHRDHCWNRTTTKQTEKKWRFQALRACLLFFQDTRLPRLYVFQSNHNRNPRTCEVQMTMTGSPNGDTSMSSAYYAHGRCNTSVSWPCSQHRVGLGFVWFLLFTTRRYVRLPKFFLSSIGKCNASPMFLLDTKFGIASYRPHQQ